MALTNKVRSRDIDVIFDEMAAITRRTIARARRFSTPLTFVEHSMLNFIRDTPNCRATDVATSFHLNRSTVSRQVASLLDLELVEYAVGTRGRGRVLQLTERGWAMLGQSLAAQRMALLERLEEWSDEDLKTFADLLTRYNIIDSSIT